VKILKVIDKIELDNVGECKVTFIRIDPEDRRETIKHILEEISDMSWIKEEIPEDLIPSIQARVEPTVEELIKKLSENDGDNITSQTGEYFVSEIAREAIINELKYKNIPLAEMVKQKKDGNPGFDYHTENNNNIIIFGEAKYVYKQNAYGRALNQIVKFIKEKKDIMDLIDLRDFVSKEARINANLGKKGYAIGFSSYSINSKKLIENIMNNEDFKEVIKYEEIVIVAVDINE